MGVSTSVVREFLAYLTLAVVMAILVIAYAITTSCDNPTHYSIVKCIVNIFLQICKIKKKGLSQRDMDSKVGEDDFLFGRLRFSYGENMKCLGQPLIPGWCMN